MGWREGTLVGEALPMASGHDDHPHDDHGHDDHGAHGSEGDSWVLAPIGVGVVLGIVLIVVLGIGADVSPF